MNNSTVTINTYHDTRNELKKKPGTFSVKLLVTYQRTTRLYSLKVLVDGKKQNLALSPQDYQKVTNPKERGAAYKALRMEINKALAKAQNLVDELERYNMSFSHESFAVKYKGKQENNSFAGVFQKLRDELEKEERFGTHKLFKYAYNSLNKFKPIKSLRFSDITVKFLKRYEQHLKDTGKPQSGKGEIKPNTVGTHMRVIRRVFNVARKSKLIPLECYPFGEDGYKIPLEKAKKRTPQKACFQTIFSTYYPPKGSAEYYAKNYLLFSYLANGMNMSDLARLKWENIEGDILSFYRKKTTRQAKEKKQIRVYLSKPIRQIIREMGNKESSYIFPILSDGMNEEEITKKVQTFIAKVNKALKKVAKEVGHDVAPKGLSTYYARHGWATEQLRKGTNVKLISDGLGHHSLQTTEGYLGSFTDEHIKEMANGLL